MVLQEARGIDTAALESTICAETANVRDAAGMLAPPAAGFAERRLARIAVLRRRIAAGTYRVSSQELADALMRSMLR